MKVFHVKILNHPDRLNLVSQVFHFKNARRFHGEVNFTCWSWRGWCLMFHRSGCGFAVFGVSFLLLLRLNFGARKGSFFAFDCENS